MIPTRIFLAIELRTWAEFFLSSFLCLFLRSLLLFLASTVPPHSPLCSPPRDAEEAQGLHCCPRGFGLVEPVNFIFVAVDAGGNDSQ